MTTEIERIKEEYARRAQELPADLYSPTRAVNLLQRQTRERAVLSMLARAGCLPLRDRRILDVGCGDGQWLVDFETWGATRRNLAGIDLISSRVRQAQARLAPERDERGKILSPGADIREGDATELPWEDQTFDLVYHSMMFTSILDKTMRRAVANEMARVLSEHGTILWYDFSVNNPRNPNVRGIRKREIAALFPGFAFSTRKITLMPPLARRIAPLSLLLAEALETTRVLNTHVLALLRRP